MNNFSNEQIQDFIRVEQELYILCKRSLYFSFIPAIMFGSFATFYPSYFIIIIGVIVGYEFGLKVSNRYFKNVLKIKYKDSEHIIRYLNQ